MSVPIERIVVIDIHDPRVPKSFEVTVWFSCLHHFFAVSIQRIVDDPLSGIYFMIVFVAEMSKAFGNGFKSRSFRLTIERVVRVRGIHDFSEKDKRGVIRKFVLLQDGL